MKICRFLQDRSGNLAIITAIVAFPLIAATGLAIDLNAAISAKAEIQQVADAAVLASAASNLSTFADIHAATEKYFRAKVPTTLAKNVQIREISYSADRKIRLDASVKVPLSLGSIAYPDGFSVNILAEAQQGSVARIEIAMVLDNTGSMAGQKLADLKAAANGLLTVFENARNQNARFSLVPFSNYVNVGLANRTKPWLSVMNNYSITQRICTTTRQIISKSGCVMVRQIGYTDGVPYNYYIEQCRSYTYADPVTTCGNVTTKYSWSGCVGSRSAPFDTQDGGSSEKYQGIMNTSCGSQILPLTNNFVALRRSISSMIAQNETYIPAGILWGWNTLSTAAPYSEAAAPSTDLKKYMIVFTDGDNTLRSTVPLHVSDFTDPDATFGAAGTSTMLATCTNAKAAGITIFTVSVGAISPTTSRSLISCASDPSKSFAVASSSQLASTFQGIANSIMEPLLTE
nr:pilus assembly protein TadG-related protein [uncultured Gellertiella sp.]